VVAVVAGVSYDCHHCCGLWWYVDIVVVNNSVYSCSCDGCWCCLVADNKCLACFQDEKGYLVLDVCYPYLG
jgi:hypothetical protein